MNFRRLTQRVKDFLAAPAGSHWGYWGGTVENIEAARVRPTVPIADGTDSLVEAMARGRAVQQRKAQSSQGASDG